MQIESLNFFASLKTEAIEREKAFCFRKALSGYIHGKICSVIHSGAPTMEGALGVTENNHKRKILHSFYLHL